MRRLLSTIIVALSVVALARAQAPPKIKVLILTGVNNHDWRSTTPVLRDILERSGRFDVRINEECRGCSMETFAPYDVLLLNYNDWKNSGPWWDDQARQALLDYARNGKGVVSYHASNNAFWGWPEFDKFVGGTWRDTAGHGPLHSYTVNIVDREHPVTKGLPATFGMNDELYHRLSMQPNVHVLASAFDDPKNCYKPNEGCGTGKEEPLIWTVQYGQGRVFQTALGHDAKAMQSPGFVITLLRGTEWAATGAVTIPVPGDMK